MPKNNVNVSIILPTFNRADILMKSVESILRQTYSCFELIIVDDGSTDNTKEALSSSFSDDRIRYLRLEENSGVSNARNIGVQNARYDTIAFHDSDDIWHPEKLERQLNYWKTQPEDLLVYCAFERPDPAGKRIKTPASDIDIDFLEGDILGYLLQSNFIGIPTIVMKKDAFSSVGGFDPSYPALEDWDLVVRVSRTGSIGYVNEVLLDAARTSGGISSSPLNYYKARCMLLANYLDDINRFGLFDHVAGDILQRASVDNIVNEVKNIMMFELANKKSGEFRQ